MKTTKKINLEAVITQPDMLANYFAVGNIIPSYGGGFDKVIDYEAPRGWYGFTVRVAECTADGVIIGNTRRHGTCPTMRNYLKVVGAAQLV